MFLFMVAQQNPDCVAVSFALLNVQVELIVFIYDKIGVVLSWSTLCDDPSPPDFIIEGAVFKKVL